MRFIPPLIDRDVLSDAEEGEEKARLIAALGHDLKGPLHVLGLSMQNLLSRVADSETRAILQTAEAAFDEVASLSEDLLDTFRFGVGVASSREDGLSLENLLEDVRRRFRRRAELEHIELRIAPTRIHCVVDKHLLQRTVGNLVENALKHSSARRVLIGARLLGEVRVQLQVVDDGCGIPESELPFIFDEWFRGHRATSDGTRGQGLGLWAVRRCVEAMQGTICVDSEVGKGTKFSIEFTSFAKRLDRPVVLGEAYQGSLASKVVAVLDDDVEALRALRTSLESLDIRVFATTDDLHLLAFVANANTPPDLFLLDFDLGGGTVERTLRMLKGKLGPRLNAIVISGHSSSQRLRETQVGIPIISKPLSQANLRAIVEVLSGTRECGQASFS
jgi:CheY-like chemotaxis protein/two-component sensor histidine kinase